MTFFFSIFGTFLGRFASCFENSFLTSNSSADPSKVTLWAFEAFLKNTEKRNLLEDFSSGLFLKMITDDDFEDGISELVMILCKNSYMKELNELLEFLKDFID